MPTLTVGLKGGDWSEARPTTADIQGAGLKFGCRYAAPLNPDGTLYGPSAVKVIQPAEYNWLITILLMLFLNYEWYEARMDEGAPAGKQDAFWACTWAFINLHYPNGYPIIYSNDKQGTPYAIVKAYLLAVKAQQAVMPGAYSVGYYGPQNICAALAADPDMKFVVVIWQTCAWSGGVYGGTGQLYQEICSGSGPGINGVDLDWIKINITIGEADLTPDQEKTLNAILSRLDTIVLDPNHPQSLPGLQGRIDGVRKAIDGASNAQSLRQGMTDTWNLLQQMKGMVDTVEPSLAGLKTDVATVNAFLNGLIATLLPQVVTAVSQAFPGGPVSIDLDAFSKALAPLLAPLLPQPINAADLKALLAGTQGSIQLTPPA